MERTNKSSSLPYLQVILIGANTRVKGSVDSDSTGPACKCKRVDWRVVFPFFFSVRVNVFLVAFGWVPHGHTLYVGDEGAYAPAAYGRRISERKGL